MFKIERAKSGGFICLKLINSNSGENITVITGYGANVTEIVLNKKGRNHSIINGLNEDEIATGNKSFKSTKLIPFPNRIENGRYVFIGKSYQLPINYETHAIHGLILDRIFDVVGTEADNNQASVTLKYDYDGNIPGYPFKYRAIITYRLLEKRGFVSETNITNTDSSAIPIGDGWHPYFKTEGKVDKLRIKIPSKYRVEVDKLIPTGKLILEEYRDPITIGYTNFDTGFVLDEKKE